MACKSSCRKDVECKGLMNGFPICLADMCNCSKTYYVKPHKPDIARGAISTDIPKAFLPTRDATKMAIQEVLNYIHMEFQKLGQFMLPPPPPPPPGGQYPPQPGSPSGGGTPPQGGAYPPPQGGGGPPHRQGPQGDRLGQNPPDRMGGPMGNITKNPEEMVLSKELFHRSLELLTHKRMLPELLKQVLMMVNSSSVEESKRMMGQIFMLLKLDKSQIMPGPWGMGPPPPKMDKKKVEHLTCMGKAEFYLYNCIHRSEMDLF